MDFHEPSEKILRSFGLLMGGVLTLITLVMVFQGMATTPWFTAGMALAFWVAALAAPRALRGFHWRWMKFADVIGRFNAKLIIGIVYILFFSLMRFVFLVLRKDPMNRKFDPSANSYWLEHESLDEGDPKRYEKQF